VPTREGEGEGEGEPELSIADARRLEAGFATADANSDEQLSLAEAQTIINTLTQGQFDLVDGNGDGFLTLTEIREYIDDNTENPGGCGAKSLASETLRARLGDLFLLGLALGTLAVFRSRK